MGRITTAWTDICSCNICIHHIHVDYAGGTTPRMGEVELRLEQQSRAMQENCRAYEVYYSIFRVFRGENDDRV